MSIALAAFIGMQFVQPNRTNPHVAPAASLLARTPPEITALLDRSCRDCHSNETRWPLYSYVAPMSWLVADHITLTVARSSTTPSGPRMTPTIRTNFSAICSLAQRERMPLPSYVLIHRGAKLSPDDVKRLCAWSDKMRDTLQ